MRATALAVFLTATAASAETLNRPVPQPQSATAELWFALASLALLAALFAVHRLVMRR